MHLITIFITFLIIYFWADLSILRLSFSIKSSDPKALPMILIALIEISINLTSDTACFGLIIKELCFEALQSLLRYI